MKVMPSAVTGKHVNCFINICHLGECNSTDIWRKAGRRNSQGMVVLKSTKTLKVLLGFLVPSSSGNWEIEA